MSQTYIELKEAIREKWDESSKSYDSYHGHGIKSKEEREAWKKVLGKVLSGSRLKVLDVGCGTGEMSLLLAEMGHQVIGIDLSEMMLEKARAKARAARAGASFEPGDAEALSFPDSSFDVVINRHLLWTLSQPDVALREWLRVLKEGGKVIVIDGLWRDGSAQQRIHRLLGDLCIFLLERQNPRKGWYSRQMNSALPHPGGMSAEQAESYLEKAGFTAVKFDYLDELQEIQKRQMSFSQKITYNMRYYMASGKKKPL